jgi:site-specific DNA-methyltransferase (adenine-specific)
LGSGSIAIACHDLGFDLTGYELDKDYFDAMMKRFENHKKQLRLAI